ncbi:MULTISPECIES: NAD(P)/FAD-dependent oxidoreductase [Streptomyces]|uniref:NAD(P)/FAD-dependent oxidoreductase n=1 Tax=Streptomyces TaxID=1883 RepID=UPI001E39019B|nr:MULTISPECIES: NAD(P)/FAD-dependent oxidoreductase [Streptomyces]UFQ19251.1 FAD-dependent oxidoreductase [Streptomyces huasconensis]WCL88870.1 NAD(P)/FAD-dependent oxidoreductase [Streptomyces sp. JCM 35825]
MPGSIPETYDLAVLGAGPAGLAGAVTAAELGLSVVLLDASDRPGGQFYRHPAPAMGATRPEALHHDWAAYTDLRDRLAASDVAQRLGHHVWTVTREATGDGWTIHALTGEEGGEDDTRVNRYGDDHGQGDGHDHDHDHDHEHGHDSRPAQRPVTLRAHTLLLATGSYERHLPFPGWTLPGVVSAGGAQATLKSGLALPGRRVVVAGSGPLLLAVATSLATAGAAVPEVVEASGYLGYARHPTALATNPHKLAEAALHGTTLLRHRTRLRTRSAVTAAHGADRVEAVTVSRLDRNWRPVPGTGRRVTCDALAVGHGLIPQIDLATTLGCATRRTADGTHALAVSPLQETSLRGLWAAGETSGIGGAQLARTEGELAAYAIAARLTGERPAPLPRLRALRRRLDRMRAFAETMAAAHAPGPGWTRWLTDDTDVCRCEEVTAGRVREAVADYGARDARTAKLLTRAGMGWCQGRVCGTAVTCLAASATTAPAPAPPDRRLLATPVPLGTLARLATTATEPDGHPDHATHRVDPTDTTHPAPTPGIPDNRTTPPLSP